MGKNLLHHQFTISRMRVVGEDLGAVDFRYKINNRPPSSEMKSRIQTLDWILIAHRFGEAGLARHRSYDVHEEQGTSLWMTC